MQQAPYRPAQHHLFGPNVLNPGHMKPYTFRTCGHQQTVLQAAHTAAANAAPATAWLPSGLCHQRRGHTSSATESITGAQHWLGSAIAMTIKKHSTIQTRCQTLLAEDCLGA
jgi:hypothetical protein